MELKIADPISGEVLPLDTSGEICARGYQTMKGYFNAADATGATLREDGWLHTGDSEQWMSAAMYASRAGSRT